MCKPQLYLLWFLDSTFFQVFPKSFSNLLLSVHWMWHSPQYSMIFPSGHNKVPVSFLVGCSCLQFILLDFQYVSIVLCHDHYCFFFVRWGITSINDSIIAPAVSYDSELMGKFMPALLSVVKLIDFILFKSSFSLSILIRCTLFNLNLDLNFDSSFDKLCSTCPHQKLFSGLQDSVALTVPSVNVQGSARYSAGCL